MQEKLLRADAYEITAHGAKKSSRGKPLEHKKSVIYGGRRRVFVDREDQIYPEVQLIDASVRSPGRLD
jgi:hypothetical protein